MARMSQTLESLSKRGRPSRSRCQRAARDDGCDAESHAVSACTACVAYPTDNACDTCSINSCCSQRKDYAAAPDIDAFVDCTFAPGCTTKECFDGCVAASPKAGNAFLAMQACENKSCTADCVCGANASDGTCGACTKSKCCGDYGKFTTGCWSGLCAVECPLPSP